MLRVSAMPVNSPIRFGNEPTPQPKRVYALGAVVLDNIGTVSDSNINKNPDGTLDLDHVVGKKLEATGPINMCVGGGAANTAVNFKKLGFVSGVISRIANDDVGQLLISKLKALGIDLSLLQQHTLQGPNDTEATGVSLVFSVEGYDRTIVTWRGASQNFNADEVDWEKLKHADGLYISNFTCKNKPAFLAEAVRFVKEHHGVVAFNPGKGQISQGKEALAPILQKLDILTVNLGEAEDLSALPKGQGVDVYLKSLQAAGPQIVIITDGRNGSFAYDGQTKYTVPVFDTTVKSTLGAGDAFGSTFMAYYMKDPTDIAGALLRASANAASVVSHVGAQVGLLKSEDLESWLTRQPNVQVSATPMV